MSMLACNDFKGLCHDIFSPLVLSSKVSCSHSS
jgi:hypothetical protein